MMLRNESEGQYMNCIRYALFSFARGESPITCVEFAGGTSRPGSAPDSPRWSRR